MLLPDHFMGYGRADGRVGTRNHVLILPLSTAANRAATLARAAVPDAVGVEWHQDVGPDIPGFGLAVRVVSGFVDHPNVYATVLVAVRGDDALWQAAARAIPPHARWTLVTLDEAGGTRNAARLASEHLAHYRQAAARLARSAHDVAALLLGTECGGSDGCSGLSANPALGHASDLLIARGGTSILAEIPELIGAEHLLAARAATPSVGQRLVGTVAHAEQSAMRLGEDFRGAQPAPGNMAGGITTIEEKSLGCVHKGGVSPLVDVIDYAERPRVSGLNVMDTPGHDVMQLVGMAAAGAQIIVFTTGRGTPTGSPITPVIKVSTRTALWRELPDLIDLDAGPVIAGHLDVTDVGQQIYRKVIAVANGELTAAERFGHHEFGVFHGWEVLDA